MGVVRKRRAGFGAGTVVHGGDDHRRAFHLGVLLDRQRRQRAPAQQHDQQVDHDRDDRMPDEVIRDRGARTLGHFTFSSSAGRGIRDGDQHPFTQLERSRGGHPFSRAQAAQHQHRIAHHLAGLHRAEVRARLALVIRGEHEHVIAVGPLAERAHRDGHSRGGGADRSRTRTDAPGAKAWRGSDTRARTVAFRVIDSPASIAAMRAVTGVADSEGATWSESPTRNPAAIPWATVKSMLADPPDALERGELGAFGQVLSRWTSERPIRARNPARRVLRAMMARIRAISASATSRSARARSTSSAETAWWGEQVLQPLEAGAGEGERASRAWSSARSTDTSSAIRIAPGSTIRPGVRASAARYPPPRSGA